MCHIFPLHVQIIFSAQLMKVVLVYIVNPFFKMSELMNSTSRDFICMAFLYVYNPSVRT